MRSLLTNHGLVLLRIAVGPRPVTLSEIASDIGIQGQAAYSIVRDLVDEGLIVKTKRGRRNDYDIHWDKVGTYDLLPPNLTVARTMALLSFKSPRSGGGRARVRRQAAIGAAAARRGLDGFVDLLRTAPRTRVLLALLQRPHALPSEVADSAGMPETSATTILQGLEAEGLAQRETWQRESRYSASPVAFQNEAPRTVATMSWPFYSRGLRS